jgi:hypothetical protein
MILIHGHDRLTDQQCILPPRPFDCACSSVCGAAGAAAAAMPVEHVEQPAGFAAFVYSADEKAQYKGLTVRP